MVLGIIDAVLFIVMCMRFIEKRFFKSKPARILSTVHLPASIIVYHYNRIAYYHRFPPAQITPSLCFDFRCSQLTTHFFAVYSGYRIRKGQTQCTLHRISALGSFVCIVFHIFPGYASVVTYQNHVGGLIIDEVDFSRIADGVYIGECDVTYIYAKVKITVESGIIKDITLLEHRNERGKSAERIIDDILDQQNINVDAISGASNSSTVIQQAIANAMSTADKADRISTSRLFHS